ncbi:D-Tyr tRNAtyr deacylase-like domain-containing protein [Lipomyces oligophaga]|uniref:D-Tyr tRNAtyr deacylase-like domain-containing protein n=1 Tax=Lipomyces oligophaga TaxID=45792 RepID=UPI0034CD721B
MKAVVQRVRSASVTVDDKLISVISRGLVVLLGVEVGDTQTDAEILASKIAGLRVFPSIIVQSTELSDVGEEATQLNKQWDRSVVAIDGEILCISQFTLLAKVKKNKPGFHHAEKPDQALELYNYAMDQMRKQFPGTDNEQKVKPGVFGAYMQVALVNDGPVTIELASR